jgi:hypothetical protein
MKRRPLARTAASQPQKEVFDNMSIYQSPLPVNRPGAGDRERELLTKAINTAIARARLTTNTLESIAAALRHKEATVAEVREWLREEGLDALVTRHMPKGGVS